MQRNLHRDHIAQTICTIITEELELPAGTITATTTLRDIPGVESVKYLRVIAKLERLFDVELEDDVVFGTATVQEVAIAVEALAAEAAR
jgi:acyl carrier protein